jgi:methyl-accepting chemotaxis protein
MFSFPLLNGFTKDKSVAEKKRITMLFFIILGVSFAAVFLAFVNLFSGVGKIRSLVFIIFSIFLITNLIILRKNYKLAGNAFAVTMIVAGLLSINVTGMIPPYYISYVSGFYILFGMIVVSSLFSTPLVFRFTIVLIFIGVIIMYYRSKGLYVDHQYDMVEISQAAIVRFFAVILVTALSMDYVIRSNAKILQHSDNETAQKDAQNAKLKTVLKSIEETVNSLNDFVNQLSNSSEQLRNSASEQAEYSEEAGNNMEELSASISNSSKKAESSIVVAKETDKRVNESSELLKQALKAVQQISERTDFIKDIAERTDILAINASIEASRAGEYGRGFSVVASEIRKLSEKSNVAAKGIGELVEHNVNISQKAGVSMEQMVEQVAKIIDEVIHISKSMFEQNDSVRQMNDFVNMINNSSQANAGLAESLASGINTLKQNANALNKLLLEYQE